MSFIIKVAIPTPLHTVFDYLCAFEVEIGMRVKVPFAHRKVIGIVLGFKKNSGFDKLRSVIEVLDKKPLLDKDILDFLLWAAKYYHHPIGEVIATAIPKNLHLGKQAVIKKDTDNNNKIIKPNFTTTHEQDTAIKKILQTQDNYQGFLLHGVTGSGKTEVYLRITEVLLKKNKQVLILVPEIGLTPQMIQRFSSRLKTNVAVIHSQLNQTQKLDGYLLAKTKKAGVVLGTRSAIFTQMPNLGMIVVDEEHDNSFKQQSSFRYSARDLSFVRAKQANIPLILGSATPSLETLKNVIDNKLVRLTLNERTAGAVMPKVDLVDMRSDFNGILSAVLVSKIKKYLAKNKQVMLFINRRGYAPLHFCTKCGWQELCSRCDAKMIYHKNINRLKCHHCGSEKSLEHTCPDCSEQSLQVLGYGTQRLEETLISYFSKTPIIRIDRDTTRRKKAFKEHLEQINSGKPCIIIGTQMLAKGHDFSNLAMVGILDADAGLLSLDFRATEHLAQLLIQVSGRAGRDIEAGEVIIQTRYPKHPIFKYITSSHYIGFAKELLKQRSQALLPPFSHQALLTANSKNKQNAEDFLKKVATILDNIQIKDVEIWGPVADVIPKKADYYYYNLYLQSKNRELLHQMLTTFYKHLDNIKLKNRVRWYLDIDPINN